MPRRHLAIAGGIHVGHHAAATLAAAGGEDRKAAPLLRDGAHLSVDPPEVSNPLKLLAGHAKTGQLFRIPGGCTPDARYPAHDECGHWLIMSLLTPFANCFSEVN